MKNTIRFLINFNLFFVFVSCGTVTIETSNNFEQVELPDSSIVYLNQNSSISYSKNFDARQVTLEGEAFFIVTPRDIPFFVTTELGEVKVLGTEFNVNTSVEKLEVEVEEGNVEMKVKGNKVMKEIKKAGRGVYVDTEGAIQEGKAEFNHKLWIKNLELELKKVGKELKKGAKELNKESKKLHKHIKNETKKINKKIN